MKSILAITSLFGLAMALSACGEEKKPGNGTENTVPFLLRHDLDGDGKADKINFTAAPDSAHCCLVPSIELSSTAKVVKYAFSIDDPFGGKVDDSQPGIFDVRNFDDDPLPEVFMKIETFRGKMKIMDTAWVRQYGISEHSIVIEYEAGELRCRNASGSPAAVFVNGIH